MFFIVWFLFLILDLICIPIFWTRVLEGNVNVIGLIGIIVISLFPAINIVPIVIMIFTCIAEAVDNKDSFLRKPILKAKK